VLYPLSYGAFPFYSKCLAPQDNAASLSLVSSKGSIAACTQARSSTVDSIQEVRLGLGITNLKLHKRVVHFADARHGEPWRA
jgi:hypothetical protein